MQSLGDTMLSEHRFCQILGRMRLYNYLPQAQQRELPRLLITDSQINNVARAYIHDDNFAGNNGELSMSGTDRGTERKGHGIFLVYRMTGRV